MLHELEILGPLRDRYRDLSDGEFGALLALITGAKESQGKQMGKEVNNLLYATRLTGKSGEVINKKSINEIRIKLLKVGVKLKKLQEDL